MGVVIGRAFVEFIVLLAAPLPTTGADGGASERLSKEEIYRVVRAHELRIKTCYEAQMKKAPSLAGEIDVAWDIEKDGRVAQARVRRTTMNNAQVEGCIVAEVASWRFPAAGDRTTVGRFPFVFKTGIPAPEAAVASRVPEKWCHGLKPPAVVGAPRVVDVGPDDARAIVAKMRERTEMPVISISRRNGIVQALAECCPTRDPSDCGTLIVRFDKRNGVWTAVGSRELPGE